MSYIKSNIDKAVICCVLLLFSLYLFLLSGNVPLFADDLCRHSDAFSLSHLFSNVNHSYKYTSGRVPAMFLNYLFFSSGEIGIFIVNMLNAVMALILTALALKLTSTRSFSQSLYFLSFFYFLFWFAPDTLGEDILWKTGTIQYFWSSVIAIACILPVFRYAIFRKNIIDSKITPCFLLGALLGGMWLEHLSVAIFTAWMAVLIYIRFIDKEKIPRVFWLGLVLWAVGMIILLLAPGNYARASRVGEAVPLLDKLTSLLPYVANNIDRKYLFVYLLFLVFSTFFDQNQIKQRVLLSLLFIGTGLLAAFATIGAPNVVYFGRVSFPSELLYLFGVMSLFPTGYQFYTKLQKISLSLLIVPSLAMSLLLFADMKNTYWAYLSISEQESHRHDLIAKALAKGQKKIQLPPLYYNEHHTKGAELNWGRMFVRDITIDSKAWPNPCYARVYGMDKVAL